MIAARFYVYILTAIGDRPPGYEPGTCWWGTVLTFHHAVSMESGPMRLPIIAKTPFRPDRILRRTDSGCLYGLALAFSAYAEQALLA
jgi:hypothetical protein